MRSGVLHNGRENDPFNSQEEDLDHLLVQCRIACQVLDVAVVGGARKLAWLT